MSRSSYVLGLAALLLLHGIALGQLDKSAVAANAIPLPDGALLRLGTTQFQIWDKVTSIRYIDNGQKVLVGSYGPQSGHAYQLMEANSGRELRRWHVKAGENRVAVSADGRLFASVEGDDGEPSGHLRVKDLRTGKNVFEIKEKQRRLFESAVHAGQQTAGCCFANFARREATADN